MLSMNSYKMLLASISLAISIVWSLGAGVYGMQKALAIDNSAFGANYLIFSVGTKSAVPPTSTPFTLGSAVFMGHNTVTSQKVVVVNHTRGFQRLFSGVGSIQGQPATYYGRTLITFAPFGAGLYKIPLFLQGQAVITAKSGEKISYIFQEIGYSSSDGKQRGYGIALLNTSPGKFAFLNGVVSFFRDDVNKAGQNTITIWPTTNQNS